MHQAGQNFIAITNCTNGREGKADACDGTGNDKGLAARFLYGFYKGRAVPGVDFTAARNIDRVGSCLVDFGNERTIGTLGNGCRRNDRDAGKGGCFCKGNGMITDPFEIHIVDALEKTALMVDEEHNRVLWIDFRSLSVEVFIQFVHDDCLLIH